MYDNVFIENIESVVYLLNTIYYYSRLLTFYICGTYIEIVKIQAIARSEIESNRF